MLVDAETQHAIEQFLFEEAALLDERRYSEWVELFTRDCRYWMPVRQTRLVRQIEEEFTRPGEIAFFDEDWESLSIRAKKIESPYAWGESPPPRTRHMCNNIRVVAIDGPEFTVGCNFIFYRSATEADVDWFVGRREDVLRRENSGFKIARRSIFLDHTVIVAKNMTQFF